MAKPFNYVKKKKPYQLKTLIILLVSIVVIIALLLTGLLVGYDSAQRTERTLEEKARTIAATIGQTPDVINGLRNGDDSGSVQAFTKEVQALTDVHYIVVMDMNSIRLSHPNEALIGQRFIGDDQDRALEGESYTSVAVGTLGESMRAFVPVYDGEEQIGVVSTGILTSQIRATIFDSQKYILYGLTLGLVVGMIGALLLAQKVKNALNGLEPREISQLLKEREAMLASVREGVIAIDDSGKIVVVNRAALSMFNRAGLRGDPIGQHVASFMPNTRLHDVLVHEEMKLDQPEKLNQMEIVINHVPVKTAGKLVGALATFRDKTELTVMLEQLSGAKTYAETLRGHTHEFMNKLHVISAMVYTESYDELQSYINTISDFYQKDVGWISDYVKDPVLAGYLLNKLSFLEEQGVEIDLTGEMPWPSIKQPEVLDSLITVIGNSLDNAYEAIKDQDEQELQIDLTYSDDNNLEWTVIDNGPGLETDHPETWLQKKKSTKSGDRGYGMYLIQEAITRTHGKLEIESEKGEGMTFKARIPYTNHDTSTYY
ncbi:DcuS/MalK family sensor histidine kinase [Alkalihalophilus lindianensis]|uniref:histidine kinase n=1 Tax=Alkalihalophilus lindianensis TaxID=1630542 RepID=A0ABU3X8Q9_9BACI|nr:DcuS/MalK family sensor histidine kinase [Alkalihalophilus lindianensis]MDV2684255.1 DcuS/MalK family sensor histidine kinase [Alkalihalophilus lindianensis]